MRRLALALGVLLALVVSASVLADNEATGDDAQAALRAILQEAKRRAEAPPAQPQEAAEADPEALRKHALAVNLSLRNKSWDRAQDLKAYEIRDLKKARMDECRQVAEEIHRLEETIKDKERERRRALRGTLDGLVGGDGRRERVGGIEGADRRRHRRNVNHNDGLDKDKKALKQAEHNKRRLQAEIAAQMKRLDERQDLRKRRVEAVYAGHKRTIEAGKTVSTNQMIAAYEAALELPPVQQPPAPKEPEPKREDDEKPNNGKRREDEGERRRGKRDRER